ncbi:MAG: ABC transporter ATP-binding protein [Ndongobacter sp.]|nr:ABC transporter ATP-binding protein [Ndongobacter sp.]
MKQLIAKALSFSYGSGEVLRGAELCASGGEIVGLVGWNGTGKSTLLKLLALQLMPKTGRIALDGIDPHGGREARNQYRARIGYLPQEHGLFEDIRVKDQLMLFTGMRERELKNTLETGFLAALELAPHFARPIASLSGGMKKRVALACCLLRKPQCLLLDEPFNALDVHYQHLLSEYFRRFAASGGVVLLSTHELAGYRLCTRRLGLVAGQLTELPNDLAYEELDRYLMRMAADKITD